LFLYLCPAIEGLTITTRQAVASDLAHIFEEGTL
jgi:hypothetical protein